jgi:ParB/RepB/Spo0J family partition protein
VSLTVEPVYNPELPVDLVDEPEYLMRETLDEAGLTALMDSIAAVGLILPIAVEARNGRFTLRAGFRRLTACRSMGHHSIKALVYPDGGVDGEAIKAHENSFREDVNPAEEATYFARLLEARSGGDVDKLCALLGLSRHRVETRLLLLRGDPAVLAEVKAGRLGLGVAGELNRFTRPDFRRTALTSAIECGATAKTVAGWRVKFEANAQYIPEAVSTAAAAEAEPQPERATSMFCACCGDTERPWELELYYVHRGVCGKFLAAALRPFQRLREER